MDGKDAAAAPGEQQHAVGRLRADAVDAKQRLPDCLGVAVGDELVEGVGRAVLPQDPLCRADDAVDRLLGTVPIGVRQTPVRRSSGV